LNDHALLDRIEAMQQIGRALSSTLDLDKLLERIMAEVTRIMRAERSTLFLIDRRRKEIWSKVAQGSELKEIRLPLGQGIAGWVAQNKKLVRIDDAYGDERFDRSFDKRSGYQTRTIMCGPVFDSRKKMLGVIQVLNKDGGAFDEADEAMLHALASQIAVAIENATLYRLLEGTKVELERANHELDVLYQLERQLTRVRDVEQVLDTIIDTAMRAMGAEAGSILLIDEGTGELYFKSALGEKGEEVKKLRLKPGEGVVGYVAKTGEPVLVNDPRKDRRHEKKIAKKLHFTARSIACAPLVSEGAVLGAFELINKLDGSSFDAVDLKLLTLLAGQAARMITEAKRTAVQEKEERMRTIGQALSGVIHDFRSPMTVISGYTEMIAAEESLGRRKEMAEAVSGQVQHMNAMVGELLAFARGENAIYKRKVYMNKFVEDLKALFGAETATRRAELAVYCRYDGVAMFDPTKIKRVLTNLVRNALEALDGAPGKVTVTVEAQGVDLVFSVRDTGPGVPEGIESKLFESFVTSGKVGGTGLGLAVCKRIVEDHGGQISYSSRQGRGTLFQFNLSKAAL